MKPASSGFGYLLAAMLSIAAAHAVVQVRIQTVRELPARDGARFLHYALRLAEEPEPLIVLRTSDDHPGYPIVLHAALQTARAVGITSPGDLLRVAGVLGAVIGLAFAYCTFFAVRRLWGDLAAWIATIAMVTLPRPAQTLADVLSDPLYALLWTASVLASLRALPAARPGWILGSGLLAGAAYWVRVDALTLPAALTLTLLILVARRQLGLAAALRALTIHCGVLALSLAAFWIVCGRLSTKPVFLRALGLESADVVPGWPLLAWIAPSAALAPFRAVGHYFSDLGQGVQFVHLGTALLGLLLAWRHRRQARTLTPHATFAAVSFGVYSLFVLAVDLRYGYLSTRYFLPVLWLVLGLGAHTLVELLPGRPRTAAALLLLVSFAASAPSFLKDRGREQLRGQMQAGELVAGRIRPEETVFDPYFYPSFLAGLRAQSQRGLLRPDGSAQTYVIVDDRDLERHPAARELLARGRLEVIASFPRRAQDPDSGVKVYQARP